MNAYLCDTNIISELMRRAPHPAVAQWLGQQSSIALSVITIDEVYYGLSRQKLLKRRAWFERFVMHNCTVLPIDQKIAERAGNLRGHLAANGKTQTQADIFIAATAWAHDQILATRNTKDFEGTGIALLNPFDAAP